MRAFSDFGRTQFSSLASVVLRIAGALAGALLAVAVFVVTLPVWTVIGIIALIALLRARGGRAPDLRRSDLGVVA
jgi:hypothetical protein